MNFFKDTISFVLFIILYSAIFIQTITIIMIKDNESDSYLFYHQIYYYIICFMSIWCHIKASITEPGKITIDNNPSMIEFYLNIHDLGLKRADKFNQTYGEVFFKNMGEGEDELKEEEEDQSDYDETEYEPTTSIRDDIVEKISNEYKLQLKRCEQCYVVRPPRCHHCSVCKGCVMKMAHHCPWINNCIGQFTQKFFIQFCSYALAGCVEDMLVCCYYLFYKNRKYFMSNWLFIALVVFQFIICILYGLFTACMINEEWTIIQNDTTSKNKLLIYIL